MRKKEIKYQQHTLSNGIKIVHLKDQSEVIHCGFVIDAGTRDEAKGESGYAHLLEHMLFKGTSHRNSWHILNRLERIGGELNAYTTKEETVYYATVLKKYSSYAFDLLADMVFCSTLPENELEKEKRIVLDEIASYEDSPSELIFDEFENLYFDSHPLGKNILGKASDLKKCRRENLARFYERCYCPERMVFYCMGNISFEKVLAMGEKYFHPETKQREPFLVRNPFQEIPPFEKKIKKRCSQSHILIGGRAYDLHNKKRLPLLLLNNILGGPGMNSRLNLSIRERRGLVYNVESAINSFSDGGYWSIYMGCDKEDEQLCRQLVEAELTRLIEIPLSALQLSAAKKQFMGQLTIQSDQREGTAIGIGRSILRYNKYLSLEETAQALAKITDKDLQSIAKEVYQKENLSVLVFD